MFRYKAISIHEVFADLDLLPELKTLVAFHISIHEVFADLDGVDTQDNRLEYISIHEVFADLDALDRQLADCFLISIHEVFADLDLTSGVCCITSF